MKIKMSILALLLASGRVWAGYGYDQETVIAEGSVLSTAQVKLLSTAETKIVTGSNKTLCVKIRNLSPNFMVSIGATGLTTASGYLIDVSSQPLSSLTFHGMSADLYAIAQRDSTTGPIVSIATCQVP